MQVCTLQSVDVADIKGDERPFHLIKENLYEVTGKLYLILYI